MLHKTDFLEKRVARKFSLFISVSRPITLKIYITWLNRYTLLLWWKQKQLDDSNMQTHYVRCTVTMLISHSLEIGVISN